MLKKLYQMADNYNKKRARIYILIIAVCWSFTFEFVVFSMLTPSSIPVNFDFFQSVQCCFSCKNLNNWLDSNNFPLENGKLIAQRGRRYLRVSSIIWIRCTVARSRWIPASMNWPLMLLKNVIQIIYRRRRAEYYANYE